MILDINELPRQSAPRHNAGVLLQLIDTENDLTKNKAATVALAAAYQASQLRGD